MKLPFLITAIACLGLASCSFPLDGGNVVSGNPGYWKQTTFDDPNGKPGILITREVAPEPFEDSAKGAAVEIVD